MGVFVFLLLKIYKIIRDADDPYGTLFAAGAFILILLEVFINIGGNIGILPVTGITLPLVSYGGSSVLSSFILLGIVNSVSLVGRKPGKILEIR